MQHHMKKTLGYHSYQAWCDDVNNNETGAKIAVYLLEQAFINLINNCIIVKGIGLRFLEMVTWPWHFKIKGAIHKTQKSGSRGAFISELKVHNNQNFLENRFSVEVI